MGSAGSEANWKILLDSSAVFPSDSDTQISVELKGLQDNVQCVVSMNKLPFYQGEFHSTDVSLSTDETSTVTGCFAGEYNTAEDPLVNVLVVCGGEFASAPVEVVSVTTTKFDLGSNGNYCETEATEQGDSYSFSEVYSGPLQYYVQTEAMTPYEKDGKDLVLAGPAPGPSPGPWYGS